MTEKTSLLASQLGELLLQRKLKVTCVESCTGGGVASAITDIPGSSAWFEYGFVTYANRAKQQLVGVSEQVLCAHGAVSEPVVREMVAGALRVSGADIAVAISGIAGPDGGTTDKPVGTVWFCWQEKMERAHCAREIFSGGRAEVRSAAVERALQGLLDILKK
ncbi:MAG: nicotinamide-nucleotide amidase [Pseudomonadales bacterium]|nr:nicotinamide-nucleotide amidase [Pseudomonadales bacterium]MCP5171446.1 nicotinamide-nucleotide amidase [Pseudomonadales bacterium]